MTLAERLLPELTHQLENTRKILTAVPDGITTSSRTKSPCRSPASQAMWRSSPALPTSCSPRPASHGHAEDPRKILRMSTKAGLLADFEPLAARLLETLPTLSDPAFDETFTLSRQGNVIREFTRYEAYRTISSTT